MRTRSTGRALVDSVTTKAPSGGEKTGPNPNGSRKVGSKVHVLVDAKGIPLVEEVSPVKGKRQAKTKT